LATRDTLEDAHSHLCLATGNLSLILASGHGLTQGVLANLIEEIDAGITLLQSLVQPTPTPDPPQLVRRKLVR